MTAYSVPEADVARVLRIDAKTLRKHYRDELDTGAIKATAKVAEFLFRTATTEGPQCVTAAIFWLKTRGHWKESVAEVPALAPTLVVSWRGGANGDGPEQQMIMSPPPRNGRVFRTLASRAHHGVNHETAAAPARAGLPSGVPTPFPPVAPPY